MAESFYPFTGATSSEEVALPVAPARIAVYDTMTMTPRVLSVEPTDITSFLDEITKTVYDLVLEQGAAWPFMLIRELVENFIHASFQELTISILNGGQTLSFCDGGPGIANKTDVLRPGFSSATKAMKRYIRGVGAGLPIVAEQMHMMNGVMTIEDNIDHGTVVTVSLDSPSSTTAPETINDASRVIPFSYPVQENIPVSKSTELDDELIEIMSLFITHQVVGGKEVSECLGCSPATSSRRLGALAKIGYIKKSRQKYVLTPIGEQFLRLREM